MRFKDYVKLEEAVWDKIPENGFVTDKHEIETWLERFNVWEGRVEIDDEGQVSVFGHPVRIQNRRMKRLPIKFKYVEKDFSIVECGLRSLLGCPDEVGGSFKCSENRLRSLEYAPKKVGRNFNCDKNILTNLKGCPEQITGWFDASDNELVTMEGGPKIVYDSVGVNKNDLTDLKFAPKRIGKEFSFRLNDITSLEGIHEIIEECGAIEGDGIERGGLGLLLIKNLQSIKYLDWDSSILRNSRSGSYATLKDTITKYLGEPDKIYDCQAELIEKGFDRVAVL